ncbi:hypothetical protein [Haladaptatus sp. DFWS20]|uniref:hypothetical protein n=1 Tax=Haladaptatus sp. DFWS20 TaxID=3403467 RepID=UPI003EBA308E
MTAHELRYAHYYLRLSVLSTLLFSCTVLNLGPLEQLTMTQSTGVVIALFTMLTLAQSLKGG